MEDDRPHSLNELPLSTLRKVAEFFDAHNPPATPTTKQLAAEEGRLELARQSGRRELVEELLENVRTRLEEVGESLDTPADEVDADE